MQKFRLGQIATMPAAVSPGGIQAGAMPALESVGTA